MTDTSNSGGSTPSRFTAQAVSAEDRLKADTVGLVTLDDFRKRRAEALEADSSAPGSGADTPDGRDAAAKPTFKKRKKAVKKGGLSFGVDDEEGDTGNVSTAKTTTDTNTPQDGADSEAPSDTSRMTFKKKSLRPSSAVELQPKAMTKSAMLKEAQLKEQLKKEFAQIQEAVKATEFAIPFVFYDGKNATGGVCRMKKGDHVWLFLERARKLGANLAVKGDRARRDWARISVDDLMVVKGDIIIPHHYEFYYFIINRTIGYQGPLFSYSAEPTPATPTNLLPSNLKSSSATPEPETSASLQTAAQRRQQAAIPSGPPDSQLEGFDDDPNATKVVNRRWYERNKHIYPASTWEEFEPERDYSSGVRKDKDGNAMFFSW
ncbi:related to XAP-5 [Lecanosticta acicola]|uniref:Related to XAP-5 n=1 Tax=Lecanosticta acicola TaxID=111012 RepID=A0AAI9EBJ5_9PEZI|nr:related to XAP-5 [Lecanosticta acicola]